MVATGCHYCSTEESFETLHCVFCCFLIVTSLGCKFRETDTSSTKTLQFKEYEKWIVPSKA